jgi:hypothetical protein
MDIYNEFFARHDLTYFCQLRILKPFVNCPYEHPLAIEMENNYALGNFNASLFATEGIASVGVLFAPVSVFLCGLVIALGNRLSAGLPPRFILISGAILPQILLNVPLSTVLLTHGMGILFLLWYITPRTLGLPPAARCRPESGWNWAWRILREHEGIVSGCEVNWLIAGLYGERLPSIDLAHVDLSGGEQRPE